MTPLQHLLIVERVRQRLGWDVVHRGAMALGAIAPDAHRIVDRIDHRDLHFRSRKAQSRRLIDFLRAYLRPAANGEGDIHFWSGWLCHIIGDDVWRHSLQRDLPLLWEGVVRGPARYSDQLRNHYLRECNQLDLELFSMYGNAVDELREDLFGVDVQAPVELLSQDDLHAWRLTVVQSMLPPLAAFEGTLDYLSIDFVEQCMFQAEEESFRILQWETEDLDFPPIF